MSEALTPQEIFRRFAASNQKIIDYLAREATRHQARGNRLLRLYRARVELDRDDLWEVDTEIAQAEYDLCLDDCEKHGDLEALHDQHWPQSTPEQSIVPNWVDGITIHFTEDDEWQVAFLTDADSGDGRRADGFGATRQEAWRKAMAAALADQ